MALPDFRLVPLSQDDLLALLDFELRNQKYFESSVDKRPQGFLSETGISKHIDECLALYAENKMYPSIARLDCGKVIGRANLRDINQHTSTALIGYRVDLKMSGLGLATSIARKLIALGHSDYGILSYTAYVSVNNPASKSILKKLGFTQVGIARGLALVNGVTTDCEQMRLDWQPLKNNLENC